MKLIDVCSYTFLTVFVAPACLLQAQTGPIENRAEVVAEINGSTITLGQLEQERADKLFNARRSYYSAEKRALDDLIDQKLLDQQARKENVSVEKLLELHVIAQIKDPTDAELKMLFENMQSDQPFEAVRDQMRNKVRDNLYAKARAAYLQSLHSQAKLSVSLQEPRLSVPLAGKPLRGPQTAPVQVIEYADYQCPYCKQLEPQMEKLKAEFGDKVVFAFKDFPLPMHAHAEQLAEAANCAADQGKFWEYHDFLFNDLKDPFDVAVLKDKAKDLKLDPSKFNSCFDSNADAAKIRRDSDEAMRIGITGTPAVFINGRMLSGTAKYETLRDMVQQELSASSHSRDTASR